MHTHHTCTHTYLYTHVLALLVAVILTDVHLSAIIFVLEVGAIANALTLHWIKIRSIRTPSIADRNTPAILLRIWLVARLALVGADAFTSLMVQPIRQATNYVLGTSALAAGWIKLIWQIATCVGALTVTRFWVEPAWLEATDRVATRLALAVPFIKEAKPFYSNGNPYLQPPAVEELVADSVELAHAGVPSDALGIKRTR